MLFSMTAFWVVIEELLNITKPGSLLEVGGSLGEQTQKLCTWAHAHQACVHVIETQPQDALKQIMQQHPFARLYVGRSLEILANVEKVDCVFIDGDHNYYTVYNELKLIAQHHQPSLILLHDVGWPWGRRDMYYDVETIPSEHRREHVSDSNLGIAPGNPGLLNGKGFHGNGRFAFAKTEGGPRNGVLTAIDDFLSENSDYQFFTIDCIFGLGILIPKNAPYSSQVASALNRYIANPLITLLEEDRLQALISSFNTPRSSPSPTAMPSNTQAQTSRSAYIDLMKRTLLDLIYSEPNDIVFTPGRRQITVKEARQTGRDWPERALTMIGQERLNNLQFCVEDVLQRGIPGDFIETGVWRGGSCIFMRSILKAYEVTDRTVWVADSFQGLPKPDGERYPLDKGLDLSGKPELVVSRPEVARHFERFGLLDDQVQFLEGWFKDTLATAPIEQLAILRLDGDLYQSTMEALVSLYPKLMPGGYIIIDDYGALGQCRQAVDDYRQQHGITEEIHTIDWTGVYWQRALPAAETSPLAHTISAICQSYRQRYEASLREWLFYHQRNIVLSKSRWQGVSTWKNPLDMWVYQQLLYEIKPDILIEIGSKFGGSTLYFAHVFDTLGKGQVISIDIDRSKYHVRHPRIIEITGDSNSPDVVKQTGKLCEGKRVMLIHDGNHAYGNVLRDLDLYSEFISIGSYMIVEDGIIDLYPASMDGSEVGQSFEPSFKGPGPLWAIAEFLMKNKNFEVDTTQERYLLTYSPYGFIKRV